MRSVASAEAGPSAAKSNKSKGFMLSLFNYNTRVANKRMQPVLLRKILEPNSPARFLRLALQGEFPTALYTGLVVLHKADVELVAYIGAFDQGKPARVAGEGAFHNSGLGLGRV